MTFFYVLILLIATAYFIILVLFSTGWFWMPKNTVVINNDNSVQKCSIIIPVRNEEKNIGNLLQALARQKEAEGIFEVIVVDDHSDDNTVDIVERWISEHLFYSCTVIQQPLSCTGKKHAINSGVDVARGEWVAVIDADVLPGEQWIRNMAAAVTDDLKCFFIAPVKYAPVNTFLDALQTVDFYSLIASGAGSAQIGLPFMANGANMFFKKSTFMEVKGYSNNIDNASGDDVFLLHSIIKKYGAKVIGVNFNPDVIVTASPEKGFIGFFEQRIRWASKGRAYRNVWSVFVAIVVGLMNTAIVAAAVYGVVTLNATPLLLLFVVKIISDTPLLIGVVHYFKQKKLLWYIIPVHLVYPFYTVVILLASMVVKVKWKGRTVK